MRPIDTEIIIDLLRNILTALQTIQKDIDMIERKV